MWSRILFPGIFRVYLGFPFGGNPVACWLPLRNSRTERNYRKYAKKNNYYTALENAQRSIEVTKWLNYFIDVILDAQQDTEDQIDFVLKKTMFFDRFRDKFSERQLKVIRRMLEEGPKGFVGGINASKYGTLTRVSKATATRDLQELLAIKAIVPLGESGGRSTKYELNLQVK